MCVLTLVRADASKRERSAFSGVGLHAASCAPLNKALGGSLVDATTVAAIAKQIVDNELLLNWKFYLALLAVTFLASGVSSFVFCYFKARGQNLATKADFEELLNQLRRTTEAAESIKQSLSHQDWVIREFKTLRRTKLEELLNAVFEAHHWLDQRRDEALFSGTAVTNADPFNRVQVIGGLYFPELSQELSELKMAYLQYEHWLLDSQGKVSPAKIMNDANAYGAALKDAKEGFKNIHEPLLKRTAALEDKAKGLMGEILGVAS
jgi:hypothetical protein